MELLACEQRLVMEGWAGEEAFEGCKEGCLEPGKRKVALNVGERMKKVSIQEEEEKAKEQQFEGT